MKYLFFRHKYTFALSMFRGYSMGYRFECSDDIPIVTCETVVAEVDKHKDCSRSRLYERAKKMSSYFSALKLG